jgi:L-alanine-DL-glutamate epimerase-like enolase superfamily enzyme
MKIQSVEVIPLAASFPSTLRFGTTDRLTSPNVVVILRTDDGAVGFGEACPVPAFPSQDSRSRSSTAGSQSLTGPDWAAPSTNQSCIASTPGRRA